MPRRSILAAMFGINRLFQRLVAAALLTWFIGGAIAAPLIKCCAGSGPD